MLADPMTTESIVPPRVEVRDAVRGGEGLSRATQQSVRALAEVLFATADGPPPSDRIDWLVDDLNDFFAQAGSRARMSFWLCVTAISVLAPLFVRRLPPFSSLSREVRAEAIERMEKSSAALPIFGAKAILCIVYYEHPDAARMIGYDANCHRGES